MNFLETFPECSLPSTVLKNTIKMIGHHSHLRDVMGQSYPTYAYMYTHANRAHYSSVHITFCGAYKSNYYSKYSGKNLTGRKCPAYRTIIIYKICENIALFKTTWTQSIHRLVIFTGHNLHHRVTVSCTLSPLSFFLSDNFF